ncbi:MAG: hypothetical protein WC982_10505 [Advenella sp.]
MKKHTLLVIATTVVFPLSSIAREATTHEVHEKRIDKQTRPNRQSGHYENYPTVNHKALAKKLPDQLKKPLEREWDYH